MQDEGKELDNEESESDCKYCRVFGMEHAISNPDEPLKREKTDRMSTSTCMVRGTYYARAHRNESKCECEEGAAWPRRQAEATTCDSLFSGSGMAQMVQFCFNFPTFLYSTQGGEARPSPTRSSNSNSNCNCSSKYLQETATMVSVQS